MMKLNQSTIPATMFLLMLITSCAKNPLPCFMTNPEEDNIHVSQPVTFSAYCSNNSEEFFWEFYGNEDSIEFGPVVTKYFSDTGTVKVAMTAINGTKAAIYKQDILVKP